MHAEDRRGPVGDQTEQAGAGAAADGGQGRDCDIQRVRSTKTSTVQCGLHGL